MPVSGDAPGFFLRRNSHGRGGGQKKWRDPKAAPFFTDLIPVEINGRGKKRWTERTTCRWRSDRTRCRIL